MYAKRIIPCLDIKDGRVVKGINFLQLRDAGDPVETAAAYSAAGADEVVFLDITATHEGRGTVAELAGRVAEQLSIPFTVGGASGRRRIFAPSCSRGRTRCPSIPPPSIGPP